MTPKERSVSIALSLWPSKEREEREYKLRSLDAEHYQVLRQARGVPCFKPREM